MQHRLRFIAAKGVHSDSQLSYLFFQYFGLDNGSTLKRWRPVEKLGEDAIVFTSTILGNSVSVYYQAGNIR